MPLGEFELIRRFFAESALTRSDTPLGIGDDAALMRCAPGMELAVTVDTLVAGVHFLPEVDPVSLGHKALAVNLSDLAAMGAEPAWYTLALTLPAPDAAWLQGFADGLLGLARRHRVELVGGDTTRGPLSITIQAMGQVPVGQALKRSGASPGDLIYVSGPLGGAGLGLKQRLGQVDRDEPKALAALERPEPRVELGRALRQLATACIDISDGLAADLGHLLTASGAGATLIYEDLPLLPPVRDYMAATGDLALPLSAGDDYELCFTVPPDRRLDTDRLLADLGLTGGAIGRIETEQGLRILRHGEPLHLNHPGYRHF
jgi:thiamine-monophosphate kinase